MCTDGRKEALLKSWPLLFFHQKTSGEKVCEVSQPGKKGNSAAYAAASHQGARSRCKLVLQTAGRLVLMVLPSLIYCTFTSNANVKLTWFGNELIRSCVCFIYEQTVSRMKLQINDFDHKSKGLNYSACFSAFG